MAWVILRTGSFDWIRRWAKWGGSLLSGQPLSAVEVAQLHRLTEGKTRVWIININTIKGISLDRGENQREKSKVSPLLVSPYYTTPSYAQGHYSVCTDPALHGPLTNPGCTYMNYFTTTVTPEVKVKWSSDLRAERSGVLTQKAEFWPRGGVEPGTAEVWDGTSLTSPPF